MAEWVRFYADEHVPKAVVNGLRQRGVNALTVAEPGMLGASDEEHLAFVRREERVLSTQDADFLRLHSSGTKHAGLVYAPPQSSVGETIRGLLFIHELLTPQEMKGHVEFL